LSDLTSCPALLLKRETPLQSVNGRIYSMNSVYLVLTTLWVEALMVIARHLLAV